MPDQPPTAPAGAELDREALGRIVREAWIECAREQPSPKPSWLLPWYALNEADREADRRIGEAVARAALATAEPARGEVEQQLREAEAYIAALRGPLLYYFGTTHPELLAEAWKDLLGETSEDVHAERSGEIQAITFDECRLLFSLHTATEPAVLQPAPPPDSPRATVTLLLLVLGESEANMLRREDVEAWTPEQRRAAEEWAGAVHCAASDNDVPEAELVVPEHVTALCALLAERALRAAAEREA